MAHPSSNGDLLIGEAYAALFDCGMAFCAEKTIQMAKAALRGRPLDYLFLSHTHYDHIGALPYCKKEWPDLQVVTSAAGAAVLLKDTPRRVIRELSLVAAQAYGVTLDDAYSDDVFAADVIVQDGDRVALGGLTVEILETPGHTRDSLSFSIPELGLLILSESLGVLMPDGSIHSCYLTGYADAVRSTKTCRQIPHKALSLPHHGVVGDEDASSFFDRALAAHQDCRDFIVAMHAKGLEETAMLEAFEQRFRSKALASYQPREAFLANAHAIIACALRDDLAAHSS
jgi:glyoxylase-like metal-dependent hydrolase (beta-lactamase superfamily II)